MEKQSRSESQSDANRPRLFSLLSKPVTATTRIRVIGFATSLFILTTIFAFYQPLPPAAVSADSVSGRWLYPRENNPLLKYPQVTARLLNINVAEDKIWLTGTGSLLMSSEDGGDCWQQYPLALNAGTDMPSLICQRNETGWLSLSAPFSNRAQGYALPLFNTAKASGLSKTKETKKRPAPLADQAKEDLRQQTALNRKEKVRDRPETVTNRKQAAIRWQPLRLSPFTSQTWPGFDKVAAYDNQKQMIATSDGLILSLLNGRPKGAIGRLPGVTIRKLFYADLPAIDDAFFDQSAASRLQPQIVALSATGDLIVSRDDGESWSRLLSENRTVLDIALQPKQKLALLLSSGRLLQYDYLSHRWQTFFIGLRVTVEQIALTGQNHYLAFDRRGGIYRTPDPAQSWQTVAQLNEPVDSVSQIQNWVLATTQSGNLFLSQQDGVNWTSLARSPVGAFKKAVLIAQPTAAESTGNIDIVGITAATQQEMQRVVVSSDLGKRWQTKLVASETILGEKQTYQVAPARWWYLITTICAMLVLWVVWPRKGGDLGRPGIAGMAASDRPLEPGDPDALKLGVVAEDIASFLSNPKTTAPLTMAITGPWGSGKSSLMNLVKAELKDRGFLPVWFNAWHHQKGEQLLASLFAHIQKQAIPPWLSYDGLWFRLRLAVIRGQRHWFIVAMMMFLLFLTWAINTQDISSLTSISTADLGIFIHDLLGISGNLAATPNDTSSSSSFQIIASIFGISTPLIALLKAVRGFGLSPQKLISIDPKGQARRGYDPGARARFAAEFADVTTALGKNKMVIFIDDLDRCSQENLIDILENINFLASSGDCYLVLGMAPKYIEACVANAYETLAKNISEKEAYEQSKTVSQKPIHIRNREAHKFDFARQYLEKLINIEVAIPAMSSNNIQELLKESDGSANITEEQALTFWQRLVFSIHKFTSLSRKAMPFLFMLLAIKAGWEYGSSISIPSPPKPSPPIVIGQVTSEQLLPLLSSVDSHAHPAGWQLAELDTDNKLRWSVLLKPRQGNTGQEISIGQLGKGDNSYILSLRKDEAVNEEVSDETRKQAATAKDKISSEADSGEVLSRSSQTEITRSRNNLQQPSLPVANSYQSTKMAKSIAPQSETVERLKPEIIIMLLILFISFAWYIFRLQTHRYAVDSEDFKQALDNWATWLQVGQHTPRAIKRFLNHLRFHSIRNRHLLNESLLVAYATICLFEKSWLLDERKFDLICHKKIDELLALQYPSAEKGEGKSVWSNMASQLGSSLDKTDCQQLREHREQAMVILQGRCGSNEQNA